MIRFITTTLPKLLVLSALLLCATAARAQDDLVIKKTTDMKIPGVADMSSILAKGNGSTGNAVRKARTSTVMIKGSRLRADSLLPTRSSGLLERGNTTRTVSYIQQCDLMRTVHLNPKKKSYTISNIAGSGPSKAKNVEKIEKAKKGGYIDVSIEVTDLGDRKNMFGFEAKHLKSTTTMTPSANACNKQPMTIVDDGWYIDLPTYACEIQTEDTLDSMQETNEGCVDEIRVKPGGNMHLGFALQQTRTMTMNGMSVQMLENVVSLERATLDSAMFEIPADYHPSNDSDSDAADTSNVQTTPTASQNGPPTTSQNMPPNNGTAYPPDWQNKPLPQMAQLPTDAGLPPKQPGVIRIGVVTPTADMGQGFEGLDSGQIVQHALLEKLKAGTIESVPISSGVLIQSEAKRKECDYILYATVTRKKGGGGFMKQMIVSSVMGNIAALGGNAASAAASAAAQAAAMSGNIKNKDEVSLEYHLNKPDGSPAIASTTLKKKAQKDGDDVLSPLIDEAVNGVIKFAQDQIA